MERISEDTFIALLKFVLNCIVFNNNIEVTFRYFKHDFCDMIEFMCERLESKFTSYALDNWREFERFNSDTLWLAPLMDKMKTFITQETPLTDGMVISITKYFAGAWEHRDDLCCKMLNLFEKDDNRLGKVFDAILNNSHKFSTSAILSIAEKSMEYQSQTLNSKSENIFTDFAENVIKRALTRIERSHKNVPPDTSRYIDRGSNFSVFAQKPDPEIQWVFQTFLTGSTKTVATSRQFTDIISQAREAYHDDINTILSFLECFEKQQPLLKTCKSIFGEKIVELVRKALFRAMGSLTTKYYKPFTADLDKVQKYFGKYVCNGNEAFKDLILDIKRQNMPRKQLIKTLKKIYKC